MRLTKLLLAVSLTSMTAACSTIGGGAGQGSGMDQSQTGDDRTSYERVTSFDGQVLTIDPGSAGLELTKGFPVLTTARDVEDTGAYLTPIPGHSGRRWNLLRTGHDGTSLAYVLVSWNNEDPTDYLAAGWWIEFPEQHQPNLDIWDDRTLRLALVDGTELDLSDPPELPVEGQATYSGDTGGAFQYEYGADWGDLKDTKAEEEYGATVTVNVDFSQNTLQGCIGCEGDMVIRRSHLAQLFGEEAKDIEVAITDYELRFNVTPLNPNGVFFHTDVAVMHPQRTITSTEGRWGGQLSNRPDAAGHPRLLIGFNSIEFQEADGSHGKFVGIFTPLSEPFRRSGEPEQLAGSGSGH